MKSVSARPTRSRDRGFTLIEIMVVIAILGGILAVAAPRLFSTGAAMRTSIRKLAVMTRDMRNNARLYNVTTRLAISMDDKGGHSYSVESSPGSVALLSEAQEEDLEEMTSNQREGSEKKTKFDIEPRVLKSSVALPKGLFFESVELGSRTDEITSGKAYIHFFPQGLAEEAAIHITDRKTLNWTIVINPLTGRADVVEKKLTLKEMKSR